MSSDIPLGEYDKVIATYGKFSLVATPDGAQISCTKRSSVPPIVIGDRVIRKDNVITQVQERTNLLENNAKNIAANIDQIFVVVAVEPHPHLLSIDSYLVKAHSLGISPIIVLNKIDLPKHPEVSKLLHIYQEVGYTTLEVSTLSGAHMSEIEQYVQGHTSVFVGHSGVGKSSIVAALSGEELRINILGADGLGKHTTTNSSLFSAYGGDIIDTPGVREFVISQIDPTDIIAGYPEFHQYVGQCKFNNCRHINEPQCAVKTALSAGEIHPYRYNTYKELLSIHL